MRAIMGCVLWASMAAFGAELPPVASGVLTADYTRQASATAYTGDRLSLNFQQIEVRTVLQVLAEFTGLNVVTSDSVTGTVSLRLKDVPWDQALDIILQARGLGVRRQGSVMLVAPREEIAARDQMDLDIRRRLSELEPAMTRVFQLHYSRAEDIARGLLGGSVGAATATANATTPSVPSAPSSGGQPAPSTSGSRLLSSRGSAMAVVRTNQLFVTDIPSRIEAVDALIRQIDVPVKQVLIEARIVEAADTFGRTLGVKLGMTDPARQASPLVNLPAAPIAGADPSAFALSLFGASAARLLNLELSALEAEGRGKVVSSPRIVTADQVEAYVKQGFRVPYRGSSSGLQASPPVQFQEANLKLTVTPQVTPDGRVILSVLVNKDSLGAITPDGREINTKEVRTQVLVDDGGTVVIGGIYENEESDARTAVPWLGRIPGMGALFRSMGRDARRTELLIFLTPRVMIASAQTTR